MSTVHYRPIEQGNLQECLQLQLNERQQEWVASNAESLAEAYVNSKLYPFGVYENASIGFEIPVTPMMGFVMLEITAGVGFLLRLMIDQRFQKRGYGRAALREAVRRLKLDSNVHVIATSHHKDNEPIAQLFKGEGFIPWDIKYARNHPTETYLYLSSLEDA